MTLKEEILYWKKERNAVILAHNYVQGELQEKCQSAGDRLLRSPLYGGDGETAFSGSDRSSSESRSGLSDGGYGNGGTGPEL